jgi:hypothetical protein
MNTYRVDADAQAEKQGDNLAWPSEWLTTSEACVFGKMSRAYLYRLMRHQRIKSFVRKAHPSQKLGTRLISRTSLIEFLHKQAAEQGALPDNQDAAIER